MLSIRYEERMFRIISQDLNNRIQAEVPALLQCVMNKFWVRLQQTIRCREDRLKCVIQENSNMLINCILHAISCIMLKLEHDAEIGQNQLESVVAVLG